MKSSYKEFKSLKIAILLCMIAVMILSIVSCKTGQESRSFNSPSSTTGQQPQEKISEGGGIRQQNVASGYEKAYEKAQNETLKKIEQLKAEQKMLVTEAKKENISVSDKEVDNYIQKGLSAFNLTKEDLMQKILQAGMTYEDYRKSLKETLAISQLISRNINISNVKISDEEVADYIEQHKEDFADFIADTSAMVALKAKVKVKLLKDKQMLLVHDYVSTLT